MEVSPLRDIEGAGLGGHAVLSMMALTTIDR